MVYSLKKALISLQGISIGDSLGEMFFGQTEIVLTKIKNRIIPTKPWKYTDDTEMAISIVDSLQKYNKIDQDYIAKKFAERMNYDRGYGRGAKEILEAIRYGEDWESAAIKTFNGKGSYGNGAAMRVAPIGAYFGNDINNVIKNARLSAEVTHSHIEGISGAIAVALAASFATTITSKKYSYIEYYNFIIENTPESETKEKIIQAKNIPFNAPIADVAYRLGTGQNASSQDTVPYVIWNSAYNLFNFEEAFWHTVEGLGDRDTTCAMVCGIVSLSTEVPIPLQWIECAEKLPGEFIF